MSIAQPISIARHPYADGSYKKMLIDGKWEDATSGKRFDTHNPATGELLASVAEGDAEDINRAVAAARRAFEGPWSKVKPFERQNLLLKLADLVEKNFEELSQLDTLDMGAPISRTRGNKLRVLGMLRYYAGQATALHGETIENSLPGDIFSYTLKEPDRGGRRDHPVERPAWRQRLEDRPCDCDRLHGGVEAGRGSAADLAAACRTVHGSRHPARRRQRGAGLWRDRGRGACLASRRRQGRLHRIARDRPVHHPRVGRQPEARVARTRRQIAGHRVRGRRSRSGGAGRGDGGVRQFRPDLQRGHAAVRRTQGL